jgi:diacylglycerol kinase family enzyme
VANPAAQSGRNAARIRRALGELEAAGIRASLLPTSPDGATIAAVRDALDREGYRCVVAMGGDGTFREAGAGILESARREEVTLAMLPAGTANNHGRSFGLASSDRALGRNVAVLAAARETRLDAGRLVTMTAGGEPIDRVVFFDSAGWGIGARVIAARNVDRRRIEGMRGISAIYRDELVYAGALAQTLVRSAAGRDAFGASVIADGEVHDFDRLTELLIKGTPVYAGRWVIDRSARHDDGQFEVAAFRDDRAWLSKAVVDVLGGPAIERRLRAFGLALPVPLRASRVEVRFRVPEGAGPPALQLDGEERPGSERAEIEVVPRALRLIVP